MSEFKPKGLKRLCYPISKAAMNNLKNTKPSVDEDKRYQLVERIEFIASVIFSPILVLIMYVVGLGYLCFSRCVDTVEKGRTYVGFWEEHNEQVVEIFTEFYPFLYDRLWKGKKVDFTCQNEEDE